MFQAYTKAAFFMSMSDSVCIHACCSPLKHEQRKSLRDVVYLCQSIFSFSAKPSALMPDTASCWLGTDHSITSTDRVSLDIFHFFKKMCSSSFSTATFFQRFENNHAVDPFEFV